MVGKRHLCEEHPQYLPKAANLEILRRKSQPFAYQLQQLQNGALLT